MKSQSRVLEEKQNMIKLLKNYSETMNENVIF